MQPEPCFQMPHYYWRRVYYIFHNRILVSHDNAVNKVDICEMLVGFLYLDAHTPAESAITSSCCLQTWRKTNNGTPLHEALDQPAKSRH